MDTQTINGEILKRLAELEQEAGRIKKAADLLRQDAERAQIDQVTEDIARS